jgi:L,D-transpeptidase YcbB
MRTPRAAAVLVGLGLIAVAPLARASDSAIGLPASSEAAVAVAREPVLPAVPDVTVAVEAAPTVNLALPDVPPVVVTVTPGPSATASVEPKLPPPPDAPVTITASDVLGPALMARLGDPQAQLHPRLARAEREALTAFYALGGFQPLWIKGGAWTPAARTVIARLGAAAEDGLEAADYPVPAISVPAQGDAPAGLAEAELKLSAVAVLYARDARGARIDPSRLSRLITPKLDLPDADAILTRLAAAPDAGEALAAYNPPHEGYRALKAKLAEIGANRPTQSRLEGDILANMERWRWLPADMGTRHVWVNVPEFKLRLVQDGRPIHEARVIVGKPETPTPVFSDEMDHAVVNPSWYVPPSIFKNEFHSDPAYAAARGYDVVYGKNGAVSIRQPPGERNALGFVKFMFPNQHAVYLHDTPNRRLFGAEKRAFSHGCVRLDQPFRFGEFVLGSEWTEARLKSLIGRGERTIRLAEKIPVHLTYFTVFVDDKGELRQTADLYAFNNKVRVALKLPSDGTAVAEARPPKPAPRREARRKPARPTPAQAVVRAPAPVAEPPFWWWVTR